MSKIAETDFTIEWLVDKLELKFNVKAALKKWNCQQIGIGDGFASIIALVEFEWGSDAELPNSVVLKVKKIFHLNQITQLTVFSTDIAKYCFFSNWQPL